MLVGCSVWRVPVERAIALVAPFEGQYREIGYEALYAAQLALADGGSDVRLLAIDDGGSTELAASRVRALTYDSSVQGVIALGMYATADDAQAALGELPMIVAGHWDSAPHSDMTLILTGQDISAETTRFASIVLPDMSNGVTGSEHFSLTVIPDLLDTDTIAILSSGQLPNTDFRARYRAQGDFVPEPSLIATLTYDAVGIMLEAVNRNTLLNAITYEGVNGAYSFSDGYWVDAPIYRYQFSDDGVLETADS